MLKEKVLLKSVKIFSPWKLRAICQLKYVTILFNSGTQENDFFLKMYKLIIFSSNVFLCSSYKYKLKRKYIPYIEKQQTPVKLARRL